MSHEVHGELVPVGGGDPIPLIRESMTVGRLESCDICLRLPNVSKKHCRLQFQNGHWYIEDLGSTNGTKINGTRISGRKLMLPGDTLTLAKRTWKMEYTATGERPSAEELVEEDVMGQSLLEKAGLAKRRPTQQRPKIDPSKIFADEDEDDEDED